MKPLYILLTDTSLLPFKTLRDLVVEINARMEKDPKQFREKRAYTVKVEYNEKPEPSWTLEEVTWKDIVLVTFQIEQEAEKQIQKATKRLEEMSKNEVP